MLFYWTPVALIPEMQQILKEKKIHRGLFYVFGLEAIVTHASWKKITLAHAMYKPAYTSHI